MREHTPSLHQPSVAVHSEPAPVPRRPSSENVGWLGAALDAVLQAFSNISMMRQQMKPTWRVRHTTMTTPAPSHPSADDALTP